VTSCQTATKAIEYLTNVHRHPLHHHHGSPPATPLPGQRDGNASPSTTKPLEVRFKSKENQYSSVTVHPNALFVNIAQLFPPPPNM
jgi:hypothetical protein